MRKSEPEKPSNLVTVAGHFSEFDQFTEFAAAWDIDFRQVGRGSLNASLSQVLGDCWALSKARFDRTAYQQGASVPGMRTFALLDPNAPEIDWCGQSFSPATLAIFASDGEFKSISKPGFDVYTLSFTVQQLAAASTRLGLPDVTETFKRYGVTLTVEPIATGKLRRLVNYAFLSARQADPGKFGWTSSNHIRDALAEQLVETLSRGSRRRNTAVHIRHSSAIYHALELIEANLCNAISVRDLVKHSTISRRTLEYAFQNRFGISPKSFINSQKMTMVRRSLLKSSGTVTDIANHWGYWHMGQFARDYRRQFGELPSRTLGYCSPLPVTS